MKAYSKGKVLLHITLLVILFFSAYECNNLYKAGSRPILIDLEIKSNINQDIVLKYLDTIHYKNDSLYKLPADYNFLRNGGDLEYFPDNNKVAYFRNNPLEAYQLTSNGIFLLAQVYTPSINPNGWTTDRARLSKLDYDRIERRIDTLLIEVVTDARSKGVPDTLLFWRKPYDTIICQLTRP